MDSDVGCVAVYYMGKNEGDYAWKDNLKTNKAEADYTEEHKADVEKNYEAKRNKAVINKAYKTVNVTIARQNAEAKAEANK